MTHKQGRPWRAIGTLLAVGVLLGGYLLFVRVTGRGIPCLIHRMTGLQCGSCGLTRALIMLTRRDLSAAFGYNPLWPLYLAWGGWVLIGGGITYVRRGVWKPLPDPLWVHGVVAGIVLVFGVVRNLL